MKIIQPISNNDNEKPRSYYNILSCGHDVITPEIAVRARCPICGSKKDVVRRVSAASYLTVRDE